MASDTVTLKFYDRRQYYIKVKILGNKQLDALFHVFIYFMSVHVSSVTPLIIRRSNCIRSPDDERCDARNMYGHEINKYMKKCIKLVITKNL